MFNFDFFLLQRVTPKVDATISHELYVFHRWGLIRYAFIPSSIFNKVALSLSL